MNRRTLLKKLGAAVVAAPVLAVVASRPVEAAPEAEQAKLLMDAWISTPEGREAVLRQVAEYMGGGAAVRVRGAKPVLLPEPHVRQIEIRPNSITPIMGDIVAISPYVVCVLRHSPGECAECDWYR